MKRSKRGEAWARSILKEMDQADLNVRFEKVKGDWGVVNLDPVPLNDARLEAMTHLMMFAFAYPRNYGTLVRLHKERESGK